MISQEKAISLMQFLINGYSELTGWGAYKECIQVKEACQMAKTALEEQRTDTQWTYQTKTKDFKCKVCGESNSSATPYCPWCGGRATNKKKGRK